MVIGYSVGFFLILSPHLQIVLTPVIAQFFTLFYENSLHFVVVVTYYTYILSPIPKLTELNVV